MWADPARETDLNPENENMYFLENERRKTSCLFTENALKAFLKNTGYQYVIRAHECHVSVFSILPITSRENQIHDSFSLLEQSSE